MVAMAQNLEEWLVISLADLMAFERRELACIQDFARTADRDTPFPHRILFIYSQRRSGANTAGPISACAFLALRHSVRFETLLRLGSDHTTVVFLPDGCGRVRWRSKPSISKRKPLSSGGSGPAVFQRGTAAGGKCIGRMKIFLQRPATWILFYSVAESFVEAIRA